jgi:hypothetical protein
MMPRSLVSRSLEPLVTLLWGVFLVWTAWLAAVWLVPIGPRLLGFIPDQPPPQNADFRGALLLFAKHADVAWLALALMNLHLVLTRAHGLRTARAWLAFSGAAAFVLALLSAGWSQELGWIYYGGALGVKLLGIAVGWVLLWAVLVMSAREAVLFFRPRMSHRSVAVATAAVVLLTMLNIEWPARFIRGWWLWQSAEAGSPAIAPPWRWLAWFVWPGLMAFAMREKDVLSGVAARSPKPAVILAALNLVALAARIRVWLIG